LVVVVAEMVVMVVATVEVVAAGVIPAVMVKMKL
jgi:hypothetical protein